MAVVADSWWQANKALAALDIVWDEGECGNVTSDGITRLLRSGLAGKDAGVGRKNGDVAAGLAQATRRVEAEYAVPFLGHATMEPQNALPMCAATRSKSGCRRRTAKLPSPPLLMPPACRRAT